ncbi:MAG: Stk1 family PASTA domain-containing Ser/Thr kinase [Micromonosporaceae bacterium]|nr:Stk1 family PASTA domain-containing Ser/Thr kinase [Micromonosporaceae bacterium]
MTAQARLLGGRYQVGELLGYGGMAEVHRGRDLRLGRDVAIKMLRTDLARDATFQMRFRREAQNAASLNHPAIVSVYDTGEERTSTGETLPFIVMEFVAGRTLKEVLAVEGRLLPRRALEITADICAALEFSHRHGIIHRDIKPGNVMLTQSGQVKVMDFGIARALASGATTMTQTSAVIGTAQYLSPEQARGEPVDARSDVYAAGCVLYELICGHPPFVGDNPVSVAYQHVREDPRPPSMINPDVTPDIDAVVLKALAKNPLNRYQSAAEMRADLLRAAAGRRVMATPVMTPQETMAMAAAATRQLSPPTRSIPPARVGDSRQRRRSPWVPALLAMLGVLAVVALVTGLLMYRNNAATIEVPNVVGKTRAAAEAEIRAAKLVPELGTTVKSSDCTKNSVVAQNPPAGAKAKENATVRFDICGGPEVVTIPDNLVGSTKEVAESQLEQVGLKADFKSVDNEAPKDQVVRVPDAGKEVPKGTVVTVEISKGNMVKVPNVLDKTEEAAREILVSQGFKVNVIEGTTVPPDQAGKVESQDPAGGTALVKGRTVDITVTQPEPDQTESPTPSVTPSDAGTPPAGGNRRL